MCEFQSARFHMRVLPCVFVCATLAGCATVPAGTQTTLAVLETTDLHANVLSYDYYKLAPDATLGFERTATLIHQARTEFQNTLLLDNGDTIQGTALADYQALVAPVPCSQTLAIYQAMNLLGVEGGSVGNHDFDYGLDYLQQVTGSRFDVEGVAPRAEPCMGAAFPVVLSNVISLKTGKPLFAPYRIINKRITATGPDGKLVQSTVKVGIIGFTTPAIMGWDKRWLDGKVRTEGWRESAERYIPEMRAQGAELVIAIAHAGLDGAAYSPAMENGSWHLAQVPGIDALLIGHAHEVFPNAASKAPQFSLPGVDKVRGTVNGVPTVMAGLWGKQLGVIGLRLRYDGRHWVADRAHTTVETRAIVGAAADPAIAPLVAVEHEAAVKYVKTPIGSTDFRMSTYFADVGDASAIEIVNQAQADYLSRYVKANLPQYAALPVLSVSAPFKSGAAGPADYTDVAPGAIALNNAADLYLYPNTLYGVKLNGAQLKAWLERAAQRYNTIDPARTTPQELVNTSFAGFNLDLLTSDDVRYEIDVSQAPGHRIKSLQYRGASVSDTQEFLVATNNFRGSGGGGFPAAQVVLAAPDTNRDILIAYVQKTKSLTREANGSSRSWRFTPLGAKGPVIFHSAPGKLPLAAGLPVSEFQADDGKGYAIYRLTL